MCLIAFAWNAHPRWRLILLGNRDEFHDRPTAPLGPWDEAADVVAGRDLEAGGTWMGVDHAGRAAAVTNVRDPAASMEGRSRGALAADYLRVSRGAAAQASSLHGAASRYRPFNLLLFDAETALYLGNHPRPVKQKLAAGVHGLSNADLNAPWPKTRTLMQRLQHWIDAGSDDFTPLWRALADSTQWPDHLLPDTGVGIERERRLSAAFIRGEAYGTRASSLIAIDRQGATRIIETRFGAHGRSQGGSEWAWGAG